MGFALPRAHNSQICSAAHFLAGGLGGFGVGLPLAPAMGLPLLKRRSCRRRAFRTAGGGARGVGLAPPRYDARRWQEQHWHCAAPACTRIAHAPAGVHVEPRARFERLEGEREGVGLAPPRQCNSEENATLCRKGKPQGLRMLYSHRVCHPRGSPMGAAWCIFIGFAAAKGAACCIFIGFGAPKGAEWCNFIGLQPHVLGKVYTWRRPRATGTSRKGQG